MKLETLDYLLTTAQSPSISAAAERLYLSQTTLSTAIRAVEAEVGITIFERGRNGIEVTAQGEEFLRLAQEISDRHKEMMRLSSKKKDALSFRLVANHIACGHYSIAISHNFSSQCPEATLSIEEAQVDQIPALVSSGKYEYGIGCYYLKEEDSFYRQLELAKLCCEPLAVSHSYVYVGPNNQFYHCSGVELSALKNEHLALSESGLREYRNTNIDRLIPRHTVFSGAYLVRRAVEHSNMIAFYMSTDQATDWFTENPSIKKLAIIGDAPSPTRHCLLYRRNKQFTQSELYLKQCIAMVVK